MAICAENRYPEFDNSSEIIGMTMSDYYRIRQTAISILFIKKRSNLRAKGVGLSVDSSHHNISPYQISSTSAFPYTYTPFIPTFLPHGKPADAYTP